jgi:hypothetical protein
VEAPRVTTTLSTLTMRRRILLQLRQHLIEITLRDVTYEFRQIQGKKKVTRTFVWDTSVGAGARNFIYMLLKAYVLSPADMCTTV